MAETSVLTFPLRQRSSLVRTTVVEPDASAVRFPMSHKHEQLIRTVFREPFGRPEAAMRHRTSVAHTLDLTCCEEQHTLS